MGATFDLAVVGTSFASTFFLHGWLKRARPDQRALVLERGPRHDHAWLVQNRGKIRKLSDASFEDPTRREKDWVYAPVFGGTSNIWFGNTPRMLPEDFELSSRYGVGRDWPLSYDAIEEFYSEAEQLMQVSGPNDPSPFDRSRPLPLPPHRLAEPDLRLQAAYPDAFFACPTARASRAVAGGRAACCVAGVCNNCPVDAKFTVLNGLSDLYRDPRVELRLGCAVQSVTHGAGVATGLSYIREGREEAASADLIALGANALFNPHILLRSGLDDGTVGRHLHEQVGAVATVHLDGLDNFQGGTSITGHGYMLARGERRRQKPAMLLETWNRPLLRMQHGKWRQIMEVAGVFEDLPRAENRVLIDSEDQTKPKVDWHGHSDYGQRGVDAFTDDLAGILAPLPVERIRLRAVRRTEGHILGTARMGRDPATSVVDPGLVHHRLRNLIVLGASAFPTGAPANPTLTIAALSLRAAARL